MFVRGIDAQRQQMLVDAEKAVVDWDDKARLAVDKGRDDLARAAITERQSAYTSPRRDLDLYAVWKFDAKNQLRVAVSNLLAQDFESNTSYTDASGTVARNGISTSSPQARATMEMKF